MKKLEKIQSECVDSKNNVIAPEDEHLDEFSRLKKKIAANLKRILINIHNCIQISIQYGHKLLISITCIVLNLYFHLFFSIHYFIFFLFIET